MTKKEVEDRLGKPDDIWLPEDAPRYATGMDAERWCYGTSGHHTLPTLVSLLFDGKDLKTAPGGQAHVPPAPSVISEQELRDAMTRIHRFEYISQLQFERYFDPNDPLHIIQATNDLQPFGTEKALAVLSEYDYVSNSFRGHPDFLFWLVRAMFVGRTAGYVFPLPKIGIRYPSQNFDPGSWPTCPLHIEDQFPINVSYGGFLSGRPESFSTYLKDHHSEWKVRPNKLVPPDDPFPIWKKLRDPGTDIGRTAMKNETMAIEILRGVRNAFVTEKTPTWLYGNGISEAEFERLHQDFLKVGGHWDAQRQVYVRKDGSFTPDDIRDYSQHHYKFEDLDGFEVTLTIMRGTKDFVSVNLLIRDHEGEAVPDAYIVTRRSVNGEKLTAKDQPTNITNHDSMVLSGHTGTSHGFMGTGLNFYLPLGGTAQIVIWIGHKEFKSPAFKM